MSETSYNGCQFFAEKSSARKGAKRMGTVLVLRAEVKNGECMLGASVPKGERGAVPVATWVSPSYLASKCEPISETEARALHPEIFAALERHDRAPEYRIMHAAEVAAAFPARYRLQPALIPVRYRAAG